MAPTLVPRPFLLLPTEDLVVVTLTNASNHGLEALARETASLFSNP